MQNQLRILYQTEGYRMESMNTDGEVAQVTLLWDERFLPRCGQCGKAMWINRKTRQSALDLALGPVKFVGVLYEAVQGYCRHCGRYDGATSGDRRKIERVRCIVPRLSHKKISYDCSTGTWVGRASLKSYEEVIFALYTFCTPEIARFAS